MTKARQEVEAALEAALIADGWRIRSRKPFPPSPGKAGGTAWAVEKRALGQPIGSRFFLADDMLESDSVVEYLVGQVKAGYEQLVREGAPA